MKSLLKVNNLHISFCRDGQWQEAVHGIDFEVFEGKTLGIVGESGSGKSVSNLAVMQLLDRRKSKIEADSILLEDRDISHYNDDQMSEIRGRQIAMIFQEPMTSLNPVYKCGFQVMEALGSQKTKGKGQKTLGLRCLSLSKAKAVTSTGSVTNQLKSQQLSNSKTQQLKEKVLELFEKVKLPNPEIIFDKYPHELSGGQKQRVMIAMALI